MNNLEILSLVSDFPIGTEPKTREELLSKASVVAFLSRYDDNFSEIENIDEREFEVREFLKDVVALDKNELIPSIAQAERVLNLTPGFVQDFDKVQQIKESNPNFDKTFNKIAKNIIVSEDKNKSF